MPGRNAKTSLAASVAPAVDMCENNYLAAYHSMATIKHTTYKQPSTGPTFNVISQRSATKTVAEQLYAACQFRACQERTYVWPRQASNRASDVSKDVPKASPRKTSKCSGEADTKAL